LLEITKAYSNVTVRLFITGNDKCLLVDKLKIKGLWRSILGGGIHDLKTSLIGSGKFIKNR